MMLRIVARVKEDLDRGQTTDVGHRLQACEPDLTTSAAADAADEMEAPDAPLWPCAQNRPLK
jgi:hypothetical protein